MTELRTTLTEKQVKKEVTKEKKFAKTMAAITCLFFVTYCPVAALKNVIMKAIFVIISVHHNYFL